MLELLKQLEESKILMLILESLAALLALYLAPKAVPATQAGLEWLKGQAGTVKNQWAAGTLQRMTDLLGMKVLAAENTLIEDLKMAAADGKLTKEELIAALQKVKGQVIEDAKSHASAQGLLELVMKVFMSDNAAFEKWLNDTTEALVAKLPPSGLQTSKDGIAAPAIAPAPVAVVVGDDGDVPF